VEAAPSNIVVKGRVINQPEMKGPLVGGEQAGKFVAYLVLAASEIVVNGKALSPEEVAAKQTYTVPVWGEEARLAAERYRRGTEITVAGDSRKYVWKSKAGEIRTDRVIQDAQVTIERPMRTGPVLYATVTREARLDKTADGATFGRLKLQVDPSQPGFEGTDEAGFALAWGHQAERLREFQSGDLVRAEGPVQTRSWTSSTGVALSCWEVELSSIVLVERTRDRARPEVSQQIATEQARPKERPAPQVHGTGKAVALFARLFGGPTNERSADQERSR
jgi:single-stranded DNA-binding protein